MEHKQNNNIEACASVLLLAVRDGAVPEKSGAYSTRNKTERAGNFKTVLVTHGADTVFANFYDRRGNWRGACRVSQAEAKAIRQQLRSRRA